MMWMASARYNIFYFSLLSILHLCLCVYGNTFTPTPHSVNTPTKCLIFVLFARFFCCFFFFCSFRSFGSWWVPLHQSSSRNFSRFTPQEMLLLKLRAKKAAESINASKSPAAPSPPPPRAVVGGIEVFLGFSLSFSLIVFLSIFFLCLSLSSFSCFVYWRQASRVDSGLLFVIILYVIYSDRGKSWPIFLGK